jgi:hypothetical protein
MAVVVRTRKEIEEEKFRKDPPQVLPFAEWIGHSAKTARDHYLHVLDETFERAASFRGREVQQPAATPKTTPKKTKENERERKRAKQENRSSPVKRRMTR